MRSKHTSDHSFFLKFARLPLGPRNMHRIFLYRHRILLIFLESILHKTNVKSNTLCAQYFKYLTRQVKNCLSKNRLSKNCALNAKNRVPLI